MSTKTEAKFDYDFLNYEAFIFDKIKPNGEKVGLTLDMAGINSTIFDGKVTDFAKAKVLIGKTMLK